MTTTIISPICENRGPNGHCLVASKMTGIWCTPTQAHCRECTNHPSSPQRINAVTCGLGIIELDKQGCEPIDKLFDCVATGTYYGSEELAIAGRKHWKELHSVNNMNVWIEGLVRIWYEDWKKRIPNFDCGCKAHFEEEEELLPPDFIGRKEFLLWSFEIHNRIRKRLHQSHFPVEKAILQWGAGIIWD